MDSLIAASGSSCEGRQKPGQGRNLGLPKRGSTAHGNIVSNCVVLIDAHGVFRATKG
jgi:hypothetical protein